MEIIVEAGARGKYELADDKRTGERRGDVVCF